jgi:hypothetical protein
MSFHLLAFYRNVDNNSGVQEITPVRDGVVATNPATNRFLLSRPGSLLGAYLGAEDLQRGRLYTPWGLPNNIRPINTLDFIPGLNERIARWASNPPRVPAGEELILDSLHTGAAPRDVAGLAWLSTGEIQRQAPGERITIRGSTTTVTSAFAWTEVTLTWDQTLPAEPYGIVGSTYVSSTAIGHRWILDGVTDRPGGLSVKTDGSQSDSYNHGPALGLWGRFAGSTMPRLEVFNGGADTSGTVFLEVVKL